MKKIIITFCISLVLLYAACVSDIDMGGNKISGLAEGIKGDDAVTLAQLKFSMNPSDGITSLCNHHVTDDRLISPISSGGGYFDTAAGNKCFYVISASITTSPKGTITPSGNTQTCAHYVQNDNENSNNQAIFFQNNADAVAACTAVGGTLVNDGQFGRLVTSLVAHENLVDSDTVKSFAYWSDTCADTASTWRFYSHSTSNNPQRSYLSGVTLTTNGVSTANDKNAVAVCKIDLF